MRKHNIHKGEKGPIDLHTDDHISSEAFILLPNKIALVARKMETLLGKTRRN